jgi:hypothetical protein
VSLGVLFAIEDEVADRLVRAIGDDDAVMEIIEEIEEAWDEQHLVQLDKSWDAMQRALTDGTLDAEAGSYPANRVVLGGRWLHEGDEYVAVLKSVSEVRDVDVALRSIDDRWMRERYDTIVPKDYDPTYGDEDREYTVDNFLDVRRFYSAASAANRWVLFTVDQ